jgi:hypothetical protein
MKLFQFHLVALASVVYIACNSANSTELSKEKTFKKVVSTKEMHEYRASHTATLLQNGKVLISGGFKKGPDRHSQVYSNTSEIFDPQSHAFTMSASMKVERCAHTATLMPDGDVLVTGGTNGESLASAELYHSKTGTWEKLPDMKAARSGHQAVLLSNKEVLIIGGSKSPETFAEVFNYQSKQFEKAIPATRNLSGPAVALLSNGKVLIAGGDINNQPVDVALVYDPKAGSFSETGKMGIVRRKSSIALLQNGNALIVGGSNNRDWKGRYTSTEIYDVKKNEFSRGPELNFERFKLMNGVLTLKDGSILVTGGDKHIEILKPGATGFETIGELEQPLYYSTSTLLPNGSTLIAGGYGNDVQARNNAWLLHY